MRPPITFTAPGRSQLLFAAALVLLTLAAFWPVGGLGFIGYDDYDYVYQNPQVRSGLNFDSVLWAFSSASAGNWHPLTWLSLMLDCTLFGLNPRADHLVNLGLHATGTLLLFLFLRQLTGSRGRAFFVAALFAVHPLHVQSVAWISERKDVLSGCLAMLALLAYTRYCRTKQRRDFGFVVLLFALGLMAKPMLVTLPVIMLLLDFWPLDRAPLSRRAVAAWRPLLIEKIPLFGLCVASSLVTLWAQNSGGAVVSMEHIPWSNRGLHAVVAYAGYLGKLVWPARLAIFYPFPRVRPEPLVWCGALVLLVLPAIFGWRRRRSQPYLLVGWLWFLVMLLPVIGLVQAGSQALADRYMYLPSIGLFILVVWGLAELAGVSPGVPGDDSTPSTVPSQHRPPAACGTAPGSALAGAGALVLAACIVDTRQQLGFWRDNITLFRHVVEVSPDNDALGWFYLGISYGELGNLPAAEESLARSLQAAPNFALARSRFGNVLLAEQKYAAAESCLRELVAAHPDNGPARVSLGLALAGQRKYGEAQTEYAAAQELLPDNAGVSQLFNANAPKAGAATALAVLLPQLATNATPALHLQIAQLQNQLGDYPAAVAHYETALAQNPTNADGLNNFAWLLATCPDAAVRNGSRAVQLAEQACSLTHYQTTVMLGTLSAALAEAGRFDDAIATAQKACTNAAARQETDLLSANQSLLSLYQRHQSYHEPADH